ncbi:MAG: NAD-dependent epimerase/dehydratase [Flaviaesturariibacter sp.]|nr:NAD-dependent epimerase/dehydratase [Flaviaesturariibacter sp.]
MKTVLVTGATGFIGGHLLKTLASHPEYGSCRIVLLSSRAIEGQETILHRNYTFTRADFAAKAIDKIELVIHAGAFIPKRGADANNVDGSTENITYLRHLLQELPCVPERFVFLSTVDVYKPTGEEMSEDSVVEPVSLYGWSKLYGEKMLEAWAAEGNVIVQNLRIGHIYGSGEEQYAKIIPLSIRKAMKGEPLTIFTTGEELRSFLHVRDCVRLILKAASLDKSEGPINVVSGRPYPIRRIVELIAAATGTGSAVQIEGRNATPARSLVFNNEKMVRLLGPEQVLFEEGLKEEISEFRL